MEDYLKREMTSVLEGVQNDFEAPYRVESGDLRWSRGPYPVESADLRLNEEPYDVESTELLVDNEVHRA